MDTGTMICGSGSIFFLVCGLLFGILKGKAAILISGFNTMPKEQRDKYDRERMSRDQRNAFFLWAAILGVGSVLAYLFSMRYVAMIAVVIWLIVFFRDVHLDEEKAFGKYRLK